MVGVYAVPQVEDRGDLFRGHSPLDRFFLSRFSVPFVSFPRHLRRCFQFQLDGIEHYTLHCTFRGVTEKPSLFQSIPYAFEKLYDLP
jgi:hypothetical protein